jgi:hypothetical protein
MDQPLDQLEITLVPAEGAARDADWDEECRRLALTLRKDLREYDTDLKPVEIHSAGDETTRGLGDWSYSTFVLLAQSTSLRAALPHVWEVLKKWLTPRPGVIGSVKIVSDGSEYVISNLSKEEFLSILERRGELRKSKNRKS